MDNMTITIWDFCTETPNVINLKEIQSREELLRKLAIQKHPDEEFYMLVECDEKQKRFSCDGSDGIILVALLLYEGYQNFVFSLNINEFTQEEKFDFEEK